MKRHERQYQNVLKIVNDFQGSFIDLYTSGKLNAHTLSFDAFAVDYDSIYVLVLNDNGKPKLENRYEVYDENGDLTQEFYK